VAEIIDAFFRRNGSSLAFPPIVVSGERSARPHGTPSDKKLHAGDFVTMDLGCKINGYCSDITRTVAIGKASDRQREVYQAVLDSQLAAIQAMGPGVSGKSVDKLVRDQLRESDLDQYFGHGLGHGLGLLVHDSGRMSPSVDDKLEKDQVWTVEPGVYMEGQFGVRIEDDVLITDVGVDVLTSCDKSLVIV